MSSLVEFLKSLSEHRRLPGGQEYFIEQYVIYASVTRKYAALASLFFGHFEYNGSNLNLILLWVVPLLSTEVFCVIFSYLYLSSKNYSVLNLLTFFQIASYVGWLGYLFILSWFGSTELETVWRGLIIYIVLIFYWPALQYRIPLLFICSVLICGGLVAYVWYFSGLSVQKMIDYSVVVLFGWFLIVRFSILGYRLACERYVAMIENKELIHKLDDLLIHDELTQVHNRRYFNSELNRYVDLYKRYEQPFSLAILDIDYFKKLNDTYGHHAGDQALIELSYFINNRLRSTDVFARFGGEEFVFILPETTMDMANYLLNDLREKIAEHPFRYDSGEASLTVSIGLSSMMPDDTQDSLMKKADDALYRAKENGRNRVETA